MLTELFVEALLRNRGLADEVWQKWNDGAISDDDADWEWFLLLIRPFDASPVRPSAERQEEEGIS